MQSFSVYWPMVLEPDNPITVRALGLHPYRAHICMVTITNDPQHENKHCHNTGLSVMKYSTSVILLLNICQ